MTSPNRHLLRACLALAVALTTAGGCVAGPPGLVARPSPRATARPASRSKVPVPADLLGRAVDGRATRQIAGTTDAVTLTGQVRLLVAQGGTILSNNSGSVLSNNGGGIISDNGGGIISDHGAGVIANNGAGLTPGRHTGLVAPGRYAVAQAAPARPPAEFPLADAVVTVHDAGGRLLTLPDGTPLAAFTDPTGAYELQATLPAENVVLRVRLWNGGELAAMLPRDGGATRAQAVDTATSLGAAYVLERLVKGDQRTFDRLPAAEAAALREAVERARGGLTEAPTYEAGALAALTDALQAKAPAVASKLADIRALLIGQAALGDGRRATEVALTAPVNLAVDADGQLLHGERAYGRIRAVRGDGTIVTLADQSRGTLVKKNYVDMQGVAVAPDGALYVANPHLVERVARDGTTTIVAGGGAEAVLAPGRPATSLALGIESIALGPDGTLYVVDSHVRPDGSEGDRLLAVTPDGGIREIDLGRDARFRYIGGVAVAVDGTIHTYCETSDQLAAPGQTEGHDGVIRRVRPGAAPQDATSLPAFAGRGARLAAGPAGEILISGTQHDRVVVLAPDGTTRELLGPGGPIAEPSLATIGPDGTIFVWDAATARVFARSPGGAWRPLAGASGLLSTHGDLTEIALNNPGSVAFDDQDRLIFSETGAHAIRRFDGNAIEAIVGGRRGAGGDGGPAVAAGLDRPGAIAWHQGTLYFVDQANQRIRRVGPDGVITTVVGTANAADREFVALAPGQRVPAGRCSLIDTLGLAAAPDGTLYIARSLTGQVLRLAADGMVEVVAGALAGPKIQDRLTAVSLAAEAGPALAAPLAFPTALAFDAAGDLFVVDTFGARVFRISGLASGAPTIHPFVGQPFVQQAARAGEPVEADLDRPPTERRVPGPISVTVDATGRVLYGTIGQRGVQALLESVGGGAALGLVSTQGSYIAGIGADGREAQVAGRFGRYFTDEAAEDALVYPSGLAVDSRGRLAVADAGANLLRILPAGMLGR